MSSPWDYALAVGPLGAYLWVLAVWQSDRRPTVVRGLTDFALLAFAVLGLLTFGPVGQLLAKAVFRSPDLLDRLAVGSAFGIVACLFSVRALNRLVAYQVDPGVLTRALDDVLSRSDLHFTKTLGGYENRDAGRGLRVEFTPRLRCAVIEAYGLDPAGLIRAIRPQLRTRLGGETCPPSPVAAPLYAASLFVMLLPLVASFFARPEARAALRGLLERLRGG